MVDGSRFQVQGLGVRVKGLGCGAEGLGFVFEVCVSGVKRRGLEENGGEGPENRGVTILLPATRDSLRSIANSPSLRSHSKQVLRRSLRPTLSER